MAPKVRTSVRAVSTMSVLAMLIACGGSSGEFLGSGDDAGAADGASADAGGGGSSGNGGSSSGSSGTSGGSSDGGVGVTGDASAADTAPPVCSAGDGGAFQTFLSDCTGNDACVIGFHLEACCGSYRALGVNHSAQNASDKAEQGWERGCSACACPQSDMATADDGKTGPKGSVQVKCAPGPSLTGKCVTYIP